MKKLFGCILAVVSLAMACGDSEKMNPVAAPAVTQTPNVAAPQSSGGEFVSFSAIVVSGKDERPLPFAVLEINGLPTAVRAAGDGRVDFTNLPTKAAAILRASGHLDMRRTVGEFRDLAAQQAKVIGMWTAGSELPEAVSFQMVYDSVDGQPLERVMGPTVSVFIGQGWKTEEDKAVVRDGMAIPNRAVDRDIYVTDGGPESVICAVEKSSADKYLSENPEVGAYTVTQKTSIGVITGIKIVVREAGYNRANLVALLGHEFGHGLGFRHNLANGLLSSDGRMYNYREYTPMETLLFRQVYGLPRPAGTRWKDASSSVTASTMTAESVTIHTTRRDGRCDRDIRPRKF